jgi:oligosaccharide repeat unit polymerase
LFSLIDASTALDIREILGDGVRVWGINLVAFQYMSQVVIYTSILFIQISAKKNKLMILLTIVLFISFSFEALILFSRWGIIETVIGITCIILLSKSNVFHKFGIFKLTFIFLLFIFMLGVFFLFSSLKTGADQTNSDQFIVYTLASFNRVSHVFSGSLKIPYADSTSQVLGFIWEAPFLGKYLTSFGQTLGLSLPSSTMNFSAGENIWQQAVLSSGLDPGANWVTAYGDAFGDVGWGSLIIFFIYGVIAQFIFVKTKSIRAVFVILYAKIYSSLALLFTGSFVFATTGTDDYIGFAILVWLYLRTDWVRSNRVVLDGNYQ